MIEKIIFSLPAAFGFLVLLPTIALATTTLETGDTVTNPSEISTSSPMESLPIITKETPLTPTGQTRVINLGANLANRLDALSYRLLNISNRITTRIQKLERQGYNLMQIKSTLETANAKIGAARAILNQADQMISEVAKSTTPKQQWQIHRIQYQGAYTTLKDAGTELGAVLEQLESLVRAATVRSTSVEGIGLTPQELLNQE